MIRRKTERWTSGTEKNGQKGARNESDCKWRACRPRAHMQGLAASQEFEVVTHAVQAAQFFLVEPSAEIEAGFATQQFARDFHRTQLGTKHGDARMDATGNADRRVVDAERGAADALARPQLDGAGSENEDEQPVVLVPTGE